MEKISELFNLRDQNNIITDIMKMNPEKTNLYKRTDLELLLYAERAGVVHSLYGEIDQYFLYIEQMSQQGGKCDVCEKTWRKVETIIGKDDNKFTLFHYEPNCVCYPRCVFCRRWMIIEIKNRYHGCMYCGRGGINCWKFKGNCKTDDEGNEIKGKNWSKCNGILKLQPATDGYTVMKCSRCENEIRKKIVI